MCGEKRRRKRQRTTVLGSPPRVRGKEIVHIHAKSFTGITPACAGKRSTSLTMTLLIWDHPRVCGEKAISADAFKKLQGSPPRVRGKGKHPVRACAAPGITPACAGKSNIFRGGRVCMRDHPRVCGEKRQAAARVESRRGSPPRVRGKEVRLSQ